MGITELRAELADVLHDVAIRGRITFITQRGRRVAAIVPVSVGEEEVARREGSGEPAPGYTLDRDEPEP